MKFNGGDIVKWQQGDYEFAIRQFNPFLAMRILGSLQKLIIPALGGAVSGVEKDKSSEELIAAVGGALKNLTETMDGETLEKAIRLLLDKEYLSYKDGEMQNFMPADADKIAAIFWGRPFDMVALCIKVFRVNYLDFTKSCSVPTGVRNLVDEITAAVQEN